MQTNHARKIDYSYAPQTQPKRVTVKVHKQSWITKGEKLLYTLVGICFFIIGTYIVSYAAKTDQLNRSVQALEQQVREQQIENESLLVEIEELSRPERITKIAKEHGLKIQDTQVKQAQALTR